MTAMMKGISRTEILVEKSVYNKPIIINYLAAIAICLTPILGPYKFIGPFSVDVILLLIVASIAIIKNKALTINIPLFFIVGTHSFLSFLAFFTLDYNPGIMSMFWSIIMVCISSFAFMQIVPFYEKKSFIRIISFVSVICGGVLLYQFVLINLGKIPFNGKIFTDLVDGYKWSESVTYRRPNSLFSEPSYFAIFFLPLMGFMLILNKYWKAFLCIVLLFLSTSSLGIIGSVIVIVMFSIVKRQYSAFVFFGIIVIVMANLVQFLDIGWLLKFNLERIGNINQDSQIRFVGYLEYYWTLPILNQLVGVGFFQLSNYFSDYGLYNYSNAFILILINHGLLGFIFYIGLIIWFFRNISNEGKLFLGIFIIISAIDAFIYSSNFYYVLFYLFAFLNKPYRKYNLAIKLSNVTMVYKF
jgi:hypothetical protein